jgi:RimJ/RimL family protein N-acetyltransferase
MFESVVVPDWLNKPTLTGARVELRPIREADHPALAEALADPEVLRLTGSVHTTAETLGREGLLDDVALAWYRTRGDAADRLDLAVVDLASAECVGEAVLNDYSPANLSCNFRIMIGPRGRDRGLGTEATRLIVDYGLC